MVHELVKAAILLANRWVSAPMPKHIFSTGEGQSTVLEYMLDSVWTLTDEIYILFDKDPDLGLVEAISPFGAKILVSENVSPAAAVLTGMKESKADYSFVATGNMPFVKPNVIFALFEAAKNNDAAIPKWRDGTQEPLLAVYSRKCFIKACTPMNPTISFNTILEKMYAIRYISVEDELTPLDPEQHSFLRVESDVDSEKATSLAAVRTVSPK